MQQSRNVFHYFGGCLSLFVLGVCSFFTIGAIGDLIAGTGSASPGVLVGMAVLFGCGVIAALGGVYFSMFGKRKSLISQTEERLALGVAKACKGVVTVEEIALQTKLSIDRSKVILDGLVDKGVARPDVNQRGGMIYVFGGFGGDDVELPTEIELEFEKLEREEQEQEQVQFENIER